MQMSNKKKPSRSSKKLKDPTQQDNPDSALPGWPGYRTREGRSGWDPIDTRTEAAHTAGTLVHRLFTGRTRNPIFLFLLSGLGLVLTIPLVLAVSEVLNGNLLPWNAWIFVLIPGIVGIVMLVNFIRNLIQIILRK
jgi:hypothetical protein